MADFSSSTAGIQAALPAQSAINPLQAASTLAGIANTQTLNKLYNQEILNKQQELTNLQTTGQQNQFDLANAAIDRQASGIMGILAKKDLTGQAGYDAIKQQQDTELANHPDSPAARTAYETLLKRVPPPIQPDGTPTSDSTYREFAYEFGQKTLSARERIAALQRPLGYTSVGGAQVPTMGPSAAEQVVNPGAQQTFNVGAGQQTGPIPMTAAPSIQSVFVPDPNDPTGKTGAYHYQPVPGGGIPTAPGPVVPGTASAPGTATPGASPPAANAGPLAGQPVGAAEQVGSNTTNYQRDADKQGASWQTLRIAQQARQALQMARTGRGTQDWYDLGQTLQSYGWVPDGSEWAKQIDNQAEAVKLTAQLVSTNSNFGGSDARLAEGLKGSATTGIPNQVAENIIRDNIIAPTRMFIAQVRQTTDPQSYTGGTAPGVNDYANHTGAFNGSAGTTGQLAYEWDMLGDNEKKAILTQLDKNPTAKRNFLTHLGIAQRYFFPDMAGNAAPQPQQQQ